MSRKISCYEIVLVDPIPVEISVRTYAVLLARVAEALYPMMTSSASLEKSAEVIGSSHSSSLYLPETEIVGSQASEEVSEYAGNKPAA